MANGCSIYALDTYGYAPLASIDYHRSHIRMFRLLERTNRKRSLTHQVQLSNDGKEP